MSLFEIQSFIFLFDVYSVVCLQDMQWVDLSHPCVSLIFNLVLDGNYT